MNPFPVPAYNPDVLDTLPVAEVIHWLRSKGYRVLAPEPTYEAKVRTDAPDTSHAVEPRLATKSLLAQVYKAIITSNNGMTDWELENYLRRSHQSTSAARNVLVKRGLIYDTGRRRTNQAGNLCIVWERTYRSPKYV